MKRAIGYFTRYSDLEGESTGVWRALWISLWITHITLRMSRLYTGLHKVWAVNMLNNFKYLQLNTAISVTYDVFAKSYKPLEKNVQFSHFPVCGFQLPVNPVLSIILLFIFILCSSTVGCAEPLSMEQLTAKTQEIYEKTLDMKAGFIQEVTIKSMKKTEREEGTVYFKNPRMMLWDYAKPRSKKLVINAQKAWLYVPEDRMVYVQNADDVYRSRMAVRFLSGIGKLSEDFLIRFAKDNPVDGEGNYNLALTAKELGSGIDRLYLTLDGKTYQIIQCRFNDSLGNTTRLRFSDIRLNTGISDKFFTFKAPEGIEVVTMPE
jgi:outer membrane lipoprotein carrier protein